MAGFFKIFSAAWLYDEKVVAMNDTLQAGFVRLLALANELSENGHFLAPGNVSYTREQILKAARVTEGTFDHLASLAIVGKDRDCFLIVNWKKYQSEYSRQKGYRAKKKL